MKLPSLKLQILIGAVFVIVLSFYFYAHKSTADNEQLSHLSRKSIIQTTIENSKSSNKTTSTTPPLEAEPAAESCSDYFKLVGAYFHIDNFTSHFDKNSVLVSYDCHSFDSLPEFAVGIFAYDMGINGQKQLLVVLINIQHHQIVSS